SLVSQADRAGRRVAIRNPVGELLRRARSYVGRHIRLRANQAAEAHKLVNSELVGFGCLETRGHPPLPVIVSARAPRRPANAGAPVVRVRKTATRPTQVRRADSPHIVDKLRADSVRVRDLRTAAHPNAVINHAAQVFDKVAVEM